MPTHSGLLITLEGGEGGGKTTQLQRLKESLIAQGQEVITVREPGGTDISEQIRTTVLSVKNKGLAFETEVLLFQAARAQLYQEIVIPALAEGKVVIMDRSRDSSVVYQGVLRGFGKGLIDQLNNISTKNTYPDLTLLLDVDVKVGLQRRAEAGEENRFEMENTQFHQQVREAYLDLAQANENHRWVIIDASKNMDEVAADILDKVLNELKKKAAT